MGFGHGFRNGNDKIGLVFVFICQAFDASIIFKRNIALPGG
jgi:hypothetical protein